MAVISSAFIKAEARRLFAQRQAGIDNSPDTGPGKVVPEVNDDEGELLDEHGNPIVAPEDLSDDQADEELEETKQRWQGLVRSEIRNTGCDGVRAQSRVAKRNPQLRERMIALANRPRQSRRSRARR